MRERDFDAQGVKGGGGGARREDDEQEEESPTTMGAAGNKLRACSFSLTRRRNKINISNPLVGDSRHFVARMIPPSH